MTHKPRRFDQHVITPEDLILAGLALLLFGIGIKLRAT